MRYIISKLRPWHKTSVVIAHDFVMSFAAFYLATILRRDDAAYQDFAVLEFHTSITIMVFIQVACFYFAGLYRGIWRYSSTPDLVRLIKGVTIAVVSSFAGLFLYNRLVLIPRSIFFIDWLLLIVSLGGSRFAYRIWRDQFSFNQSSNIEDRIIIVGAGSGGEKLFREIRYSPDLQLNVVGFVDDDLGIRNKSLHGVRVLGGVADIPQIVASHNVKQIFVAIPSATSKQFRSIIKVCENTQLKIKTLPKLSDILNGDLFLSKLRRVDPEDLLGRKEIQLDQDTLGQMITDKKVVVSGAGGSIGSELCRQIARFRPKQLILFELTEFFLYEIEMELKEKFPDLELVAVMGDVRNSHKVKNMFSRYRPEVVFHAAAYKHVPMMEQNPHEAIHTNIVGTKVMAEEAMKSEVERFVMISTDKAVNPTNIMGTTKRIAEMVCQRCQSESLNHHTKFMTVRFGNVLGSSGSVIPLFKKQIKRGGPVTVTHPDIKRYFMSIPEAAQLVLQAAAIGKGGEIFMLEMGEPFKILNLAKQMITLAGLRINDDIEIKFTGLRPGEKLYEELLADQESTLPTSHPKVKIAQARQVNGEYEEAIDIILALADAKHIEKSIVISEFKKLVPEYIIPS